MLDRYKKKGGFNQLLTLIETSGKAKQEQFLGLVAAESPVWEEAIRKRILTFERVLSWDSATLMEVFTRLQPLTLAIALHGNSREKNDEILTSMGQMARRKIYDIIEETNPSPQEKATCLHKIVTEVRTLIHQGYVKLDKVDPELIVGDNIEDELREVTASGTLQFDLKAKSATEDHIKIENNVRSIKNASTKENSEHATTTILIPESLQVEVDQLRKKLHLVSNENQQLRQELQIARAKIEQIRKIV